jgi:hypothetical protein
VHDRVTSRTPCARRGHRRPASRVAAVLDGKHDDQVDSTAQFLDRFSRSPSLGWAIFETLRLAAGSGRLLICGFAADE